MRRKIVRSALRCFSRIVRLPTRFRRCNQRVQFVERDLGLEEMLFAQDEGVELGAGQKFGVGNAGCCCGFRAARGEVGREQQRADAVERKRAGGPAQNVERGGDHRCLGQRNAERELAGAGAGGRVDRVEFGRERLAEDAVDLGARGLDGGNDDGDARGRLLGEACAQPAGAGGEFSPLVGRGDQGEAGGCGGLVELLDGRPGGCNGVEQGGLRGRLRVEADEQKASWRSEAAGGECGAQGLWELRLGEELRAGRAALELAGPAGEGARVGVGDGSLQAASATVGVQQQPCFGGKLGERVDGAKALCRAVRRAVLCDDRAPEGLLLRGVEQQLSGLAVEQKAVPQAGEPGIPRENCRRPPVGEAERALVQIVPVVQGARGALVGGQDGPAALQRLMNLPGQRVRIVHTPFIRLPDAENVVRDARIRGCCSYPEVMMDAGGRCRCGLRCERLWVWFCFPCSWLVASSQAKVQRARLPLRLWRRES